MRAPCSSCGSVACQVQSPTVCRTLRRLRPVPVVVNAPAADPAEALDELGDTEPDPPADEPAPRPRSRGRQPR